MRVIITHKVKPPTPPSSQSILQTETSPRQTRQIQTDLHPPPPPPPPPPDQEVETEQPTSAAAASAGVSNHNSNANFSQKRHGSDKAIFTVPTTSADVKEDGAEKEEVEENILPLIKISDFSLFESTLLLEGKSKDPIKYSFFTSGGSFFYEKLWSSINPQQ